MVFSKSLETRGIICGIDDNEGRLFPSIVIKTTEGEYLFLAPNDVICDILYNREQKLKQILYNE